MNKLNVIIMTALLFFTGFYFVVDHNTSSTIDDLNVEIKSYEVAIDSVEYDNIIISNSIIDLKDSIYSYKSLIESYDDSLTKIINHYEKQSEDVAALNDSSTYVFFKEYVERNAPRFGIVFD